MVKLIWLILFLFIIPHLGYSQTPPASGQLLITEVQIAGSRSSEDYLRIYNPSNEEIDLFHFQLKKRTRSGGEYSLFSFPEGSLIGPRESLVWANSREGLADFFSTPYQSQASLAANNSLALLNSQKTVIDALAWGEGNAPFLEGNPFPQNPSPHQQLKRKQFQGEYLDSDNNQTDFFLDPLQLTASQQTDNLVLGSQTSKPLSSLAVLSLGIGMGLVSLIIILFLKRKL